MNLSLQSPEDVVNAALGRIGYRLRVGNLLEGSLASKTALDIYGQTRDTLLRSKDWGFSEKIVSAVASGGTPPAPWTQEYTYPTDCLRLRYMYNATYLTNTNNPLPVLFKVGWDATQSAKVIWANATAVTLVYSAQITPPNQWEPLFAETLIAMLAKRLSPILASPDVEKFEIQDEKDVGAIAESTSG